MGSRLYFNGDSFVAGVELGDDIIPGYPGMDIDEDCKFTVEKTNWYHKSQLDSLTLRKERIDEISRLEKERCFAGQSATLLDLPFLNRAIGGASNDKIARTTISDLLELRKSFPDDTLYAFIGTTNITRSEIAIYEENNKQYWYDLTTHLKYRQPDDTIPLMKYKIMYETEYHSLINFYKNVVLLQDFCKINNINLYWIAALDNYTNPGKNEFAWMKSKFLSMPDLKLWQEYANINYTIDMKQVRNNLRGTPVICPGGHYGKPVHDAIAKMIVDIVRK